MFSARPQSGYGLLYILYILQCINMDCQNVIILGVIDTKDITQFQVKLHSLTW